MGFHKPCLSFCFRSGRKAPEEIEEYVPSVLMASSCGDLCQQCSLVIVCSAFVEHSTQNRQHERGCGVGCCYALGSKGLGHAVSSAEGLDSGIVACVISSTLCGF